MMKYISAAGLGFMLAACAPAVSTSPAPPAPAPELPERVITGPGLPPVPAVDGALSLRIVHPTPGTTRPGSDSVFVYGSTGTGRATLTVNGRPVVVEPNGAFLAYVARPPDDTLRLTALAGGNRAVAATWYSPPPTGGAAAPTTVSCPSRVRPWSWLAIHSPPVRTSQ